MTPRTEERLRETLAAVADRVNAEQRWDQVVADARPPTSARPDDDRRWSVAAVAAAVFVAAGLGAVFAIRGDGEQATVADGVDFVLPGEIVLNDDPLTVIPAPAPEPEFDTSELGTEVLFEPINQSDGETTALIEDALRAISPGEILRPTKVTLAGRVDGQPWMIVVADAPNTNGIGGRRAEENLRQRIVVSRTGGSASGDFVPRNSLEMIEAPHVDDASRRPAYSFSAPTGWLDWSDLPAETAVVAFSDADQQMWMRPRAGMVAFDTQFDNGERFELNAYDASGTVIRTLSETVRYDGADSAMRDRSASTTGSVDGGLDLAERATVSEICAEGVVDGCHMVAVSFEPPTSLGDLTAASADLPGIVVGVWREDWICLVTADPFSDSTHVASRFAYLEADTISRRVDRLDVTPITDGGRTFGLWDTRIAALEALASDDPPIVGAALWLPTDYEPQLPNSGDFEVIPHRYAYADDGILYVGAPGFTVDPAHEEGLPFGDGRPDCGDQP